MWRAVAAAAAAVGAGGAWAARSPGGSLRPGPAEGRWRGSGATAQGLVGSRAGSASSRPPPAQSPARARRGERPVVGDVQSGSLSPDLAPDVFFLRVRLEDTGEMFRVTNCHGDMTVRELKEELDLMVGIPFNLQRLQYLDQGVLMDGATLKFHDVVPGGIVSLCIWHYDGWTELVVAAVEGDPSKLSCVGVSEDCYYRTPNSERFRDEEWRQWRAQRAFVALYITSHRGHAEATQYLLEQGANSLGRSPLGRTPLHVAAAMGRLDCISLLFKWGALIHNRDAKGETPISIARRLNRKQSVWRMFLLHWLAQSRSVDAKDVTVTVKKALKGVKAGAGPTRKTPH
ncbi:ankyrin repeat domain-containing protein 60 isoform X2 [Microcebus murinus]|uniref:ankyrin repeat domain-containing protein 60 isoform X2 n=1 Tax=Microcebus murinus TaxID=30608 RepID=UPI003F6C5427